jgi:hypothetical protein
MTSVTAVVAEIVPDVPLRAFVRSGSWAFQGIEQKVCEDFI